MADKVAKLKREFDMESVIATPSCVPVFEQFLKKEQCEENLYFLLAVNKFKGEEPAAQEIFNTFIEPSKATSPVILSAKLVHDIKERLNSKQLDTSMFNSAAESIRETMRTESFARFKRSKEWQTFLKAQKPDFFAQISFVPNELIIRREDLTRNQHTIRDLQIAGYLLQDYSHWKPIYSQPTCNIYLSHEIGIAADARKYAGHMLSIKMVFLVDASTYDIIDANHSKHIAKNFGNHNFRQLEYKPSDPDNGLLATTIVQFNCNLGRFFTVRCFVKVDKNFNVVINVLFMFVL